MSRCPICLRSGCQGHMCEVLAGVTCEWLSIFRDGNSASGMGNRTVCTDGHDTLRTRGWRA